MKMTIMTSLVLLGLSSMAEAKVFYSCGGNGHSRVPQSALTIAVANGLAQVTYEGAFSAETVILQGELNEKEIGANTAVFEADLVGVTTGAKALLTLSETDGFSSKLPGTCRARWCPGDDGALATPVIKASLKFANGQELFYSKCSKFVVQD